MMPAPREAEGMAAAIAPRRRPIVGGNWKMHTTRPEARALLLSLLSLRERVAPDRGAAEVVVFPPAPWLADATDLLAGSEVAVGAQDTHAEAAGAFTGAVSAQMVRAVATWALVGHSERRHVFGDSDEVVAAKLRAVLAAGLHPLLAVGELAAERAAAETAAVLRRQLTTALDGLATLPPDLVIAYEPVWAIGTGESATPQQAQEACAQVRAILADLHGAAAAAACRIQYGGSVTADNAGAFATQPDIDGALVGGASLDADAFTTICAAQRTGA